MTFGGGPHQRRRVLNLFGRVHVDAAREQQAHGGDASRARCGQQRRLAFGMRLGWIRAGSQQQIDHRGVADAAGL